MSSLTRIVNAPNQHSTNYGVFPPNKQKSQLQLAFKTQK